MPTYGKCPKCANSWCKVFFKKNTAMQHLTISGTRNQNWIKFGLGFWWVFYVH